MTSSDTVLWGLDGAVAIITLNRPRAKPAATRSRGPRPTGGSGGCPRAHAAPGAAPWSISAQARTICSPTSTRSVGTCSDRRPSGHRHQIALSRHHTVSPYRTESTDMRADGSWARRRPLPSPRSASISSSAHAARPGARRVPRSGSGTMPPATGCANQTAFPGAFQPPNRDRVR